MRVILLSAAVTYFLAFFLFQQAGAAARGTSVRQNSTLDRSPSTTCPTFAQRSVPLIGSDTRDAVPPMWNVRAAACARRATAATSRPASWEQAAESLRL